MWYFKIKMHKFPQPNKEKQNKKPQTPQNNTQKGKTGKSGSQLPFPS